MLLRGAQALRRLVQAGYIITSKEKIFLAQVPTSQRSARPDGGSRRHPMCAAAAAAPPFLQCGELKKNLTETKFVAQCQKRLNIIFKFLGHQN